MENRAEHGGSFDKEKRTPFSALLKEKGIVVFCREKDSLFRFCTGRRIGRNMADHLTKKNGRRFRRS
jgi:hypothetical protein